MTKINSLGTSTTDQLSAPYQQLKQSGPSRSRSECLLPQLRVERPHSRSERWKNRQRTRPSWSLCRAASWTSSSTLTATRHRTSKPVSMQVSQQVSLKFSMPVSLTGIWSRFQLNCSRPEVSRSRLKSIHFRFQRGRRKYFTTICPRRCRKRTSKSARSKCQSFKRGDASNSNSLWPTTTTITTTLLLFLQPWINAAARNCPTNFRMVSWLIN